MLADLALLSASASRNNSPGDELVAALDGFLLGGLQQLAQLGAALHLLLPLHLGRRLMAASAAPAGRAR
jgi:hypothetical protein